MFEWAIAAGVFMLLMLALIPLVPRMMARKGGGFGFALAMIFASVFDPAKAAAIEQLDRKKEIEGSEENESGAGPQ